MYLLFRGGGNPGQQALWQLVMTGRLLLHDLNSADMPFMAESMKNYRDRPMDLADASLVCAASHLGTRIVFTLDSDFLVYRLPDGRSFEPVLFP